MNFKIYLAVLCLTFISVSSITLQSHEGTYAWFTFNEALTGNRCTRSDKCDGQRTCSPWGWCQGTSRPVPKTGAYKYNEAVTGNKCPTSTSDPNYVNRHYYCDGQRTCSAWGWCQGSSR